MKRYKVTLTDEERQELHALIAAGKAAARKLTHARILLKADAAAGGPAWIDQRIAEARGGGRGHGRTGSPAVRRRGLGGGLVRASRNNGRAGSPNSTAEAEARLIALACSAAAPRAQPLDAAPAGRPPGGIGDRGRDLRRDGAAGAKKNETQAVAERAVVHPARGATPSSSARWRTCWRSTTGPTTKSGRWSAWTRRASNWWARSCSRCRPNRASPSASTTSTSATARPTCS